MNDQRFLDHLDRFGPDLSTWPRPGDARAWADRSARARAALRDAQALDGVLRATCVTVTDDFADRVIAAALDHPQEQGGPVLTAARRPVRWRWLVLPQLAGASAALVFGLWVGASQLPAQAATAAPLSLTSAGDDADSLLSIAIQRADGIVTEWDDV
ncbi:hypothetical protein [Zavarzinia sp. CC-PAN008]|uniref:hypothetical protein n=1 Tax=Zavarzinia sp. CC-PAN008 TaxID=3243332 RepID=UPI003F74473F